MAKKKLTEAQKDQAAKTIAAMHDGSRVTSELTSLSFGGGQDSTTILLKLIFDKDFRKKYAPGALVVVMSDTGNEHPETYRHTGRMMKLAKKHEIPFFLLTSDTCRIAAAMGVTIEEARDLGVTEGYHTEAWATITGHWKRIGMIGSLVFDKSCTSNMKVEPIFRFLEQYVGKKFGLQAAVKSAAGRWSPKRALQAFAKKHGRIRVLIGIARGEEKRVKTTPDVRQKWMAATANYYPLIEIGYDRAACQKYIADLESQSAIAIPMPSNCMFCPWISPVELLWLSRHYPKSVDEWVELEAAKLKKYEGALGKDGKPIKNQGVFKEKNLRQSIAAAVAKHGHMSDEELDEYKMSHGHCVASKY